MISSSKRDQQHPQEREDRSVVNNLLTGEPTDYNLTELGRLLIRYQNFPGARELQKDLNLVLQRWGLTPEELFKKTISIHSQGLLYKSKANQTTQTPLHNSKANQTNPQDEQQDWS